MKTFYLVITLLICSLGSIIGQENNTQTQEDNKPKLEIKASSRAQMSVIRDNYHRRRDMRFLQMNRKLRMNRQKMLAYYNGQIKKSQNNKNSELKKQNAAIQRKRQAIQKKRLERQKQQLRNRLR